MIELRANFGFALQALTREPPIHSALSDSLDGDLSSGSIVVAAKDGTEVAVRNFLDNAVMPDRCSAAVHAITMTGR